MREITLNRVEYKDWFDKTPVTGQPKTKYFSFLYLFLNGHPTRQEMENVTYNLKEYTNTDNYPENLKQKLTEYFNDEGRTELKQLWTVPNLPFLTNLPTDGHPEHESKRNNSFETMPKQIASDFNTKLDQISKKKLRTNFPLHPALKDYSVPGSGYAQPETVEINPEYPPFYNKYLDAKKKAGLA